MRDVAYNSFFRGTAISMDQYVQEVQNFRQFCSDMRKSSTGEWSMSPMSHEPRWATTATFIAILTRDLLKDLDLHPQRKARLQALGSLLGYPIESTKDVLCADAKAFLLWMLDNGQPKELPKAVFRAVYTELWTQMTLMQLERLPYPIPRAQKDTAILSWEEEDSEVEVLEDG